VQGDSNIKKLRYEQLTDKKKKRKKRRRKKKQSISVKVAKRES
jgi:hypothetical protein